jgi:3-phosphoshikimate 1-carboxyvinyltransferase
MMRMTISRRVPIEGEFNAPASKPETQRALVMAALADGLTIIHRPLVARETLIMMEACRSLGAEVSVLDDRLEVRGIGSSFHHNVTPATRGDIRYIWAGGSALVARIFLGIGLAVAENVIIDGTSNLRSRPLEPLTAVLRDKGADLRFFDAPDCLPCSAMSAALPGGRYLLGTDISSQFATSLLVSAPLAASPLHIELAGPSYSISYIKQTISMMACFGIAVEATEDIRQILVPNDRSYQARDIELTGDYTSASYILGATFVTRGRVLLSNLDPGSLQGEAAIVDILIELGARVQWIQGAHALLIDCTDLPSSADATFDVSDCPNILPTVAAVAATVPGRVRIVGGRLTQNHKSRRIDAMAAELSKAGVSVEILKGQDGCVDGLEIKGSMHHEGGIEFSGHGDHRIAMAMTLFGFACSHPCSFADEIDTTDSFPEFTSYLGLNGQAWPDGEIIRPESMTRI